MRPRVSSRRRAGTAPRSCSTNVRKRIARSSHSGSRKERGATIVPPYDDARIAAGAGTTALELLHDAGPLDAIVTPLGGGGLLAGCAIAAHGIDPDIEIWGVEPQAGNDVQQSFERGERVTIDVPKTIADGLADAVAG